jgi:hypothetical protein
VTLGNLAQPVARFIYDKCQERLLWMLTGVSLSSRRKPAYAVGTDGSPRLTLPSLPGAALLTFSDAGHVINEEDPTGFSVAVLEFVRKIAGSGNQRQGAQDFE